ncbi:hypothetical protein [Derxia gummosa]|uniref:Uncharacterized protein n=1 Tax=Derxia gummosa DSM 723 TaxID=1121388 RepID=A0A8B6X574_9BURK|nr:hypothetical protein [Derxia gummosa]
MTDVARLVVAEMLTAQYIFRGAGRTREEARLALLAGWKLHRDGVVARQPQLAPTLPLPEDMEKHFRIDYAEYEAGIGYRDGQPVSRITVD